MEEQDYKICEACKEKGTACQTLKDVMQYNSTVTASSDYCPLSGKTENDILLFALSGIRADLDNLDMKVKFELELAKQYEKHMLLEMYRKMNKQ